MYTSITTPYAMDTTACSVQGVSGVVPETPRLSVMGSICQALCTTSTAASPIA